MVERHGPLHVVLALLVAVIWGLAFVATRIALDVVSPPSSPRCAFSSRLSPPCGWPGRP